jgi:hypothetical protein
VRARGHRLPGVVCGLERTAAGMTAKRNPRRDGKETTSRSREGAAMIHDSVRARADSTGDRGSLVNTLSRFENQRSRPHAAR